MIIGARYPNRSNKRATVESIDRMMSDSNRCEGCRGSAKRNCSQKYSLMSPFSSRQKIR